MNDSPITLKTYQNRPSVTTCRVCGAAYNPQWCFRCPVCLEPYIKGQCCKFCGEPYKHLPTPRNTPGRVRKLAGQRLPPSSKMP
jgi:hypothetical protein